MISVIVCTYNPNESNLIRTLDSILRQDLHSTEWELLVIDNNSSVPVKERTSIKDRQVRVEFEGRQGLSAAKECGVMHSRGDILVFVDDDNVLALDYLRNVTTLFKNPEIGIVSGAITPEYTIDPPEWFKHFEIMLAIKRPHGDRAYLTNIPLCNNYFPIGAGMAVRRKIIVDYYEAIRKGSVYISGRVGTELSSAEDIDLDLYAISQGFLIGLTGLLKMIHIIPASRMTSEYLCRLAVGTTKGAIDVNKKWKPVFGHNVYEVFNIPKRRTGLLLAACACLYWMTKFRIRYYFYKTLFTSAS